MFPGVVEPGDQLMIEAVIADDQPGMLEVLDARRSHASDPQGITVEVAVRFPPISPPPKSLSSQATSR